MIGDERRVEILLGTKEPMSESSRWRQSRNVDEEALKDGDGRRSREEA